MGSERQGAPTRQGVPTRLGHPEHQGGGHGVHEASAGADFGEDEGVTLPLDGAGV
jgi:hypothetical protein